MIEMLAVVNKNFYDVVGLLGVVFYVASYSALQFGKLDGNSAFYCILNGLAATLVLISLSKDFNLASAIIQIVWITVSLCGLFRFWKNRSASRASRTRYLRSVARSRHAIVPPASAVRVSRKGTITVDS